MRTPYLIAVLSALSSACIARGGFVGTAGATPPPEPASEPAYHASPATSDPAAAPRTMRPMSAFAFEVQEYSSPVKAFVIDKLVTFEVGPACAEKMLDRKYNVIHSASSFAAGLLQYAEKVTGDDWATIAAQSANSREANLRIVEDMIDAFAPHLHVTVSVEGADCEATGTALWLKYWSDLGRILAVYPPPAQQVQVHLVVSAKARKVTVDVGGGGASFRIVAPRDFEVSGWSDVIEKTFKRVAQGVSGARACAAGGAGTRG